MPWAEEQLSTVQGLIDIEPGYELAILPNIITLRARHHESREQSVKRVLVCMGALLMPAEGLDEHLEATIERFNYYKEMAALPAPVEHEPRRAVVSYAGSAPRPEFEASE